MPLAHMSESGSARGRSKFKEGQRVSGRVLEADAASRRISLTLKKALCGDKLPPFAAWEVRLGCRGLYRMRKSNPGGHAGGMPPALCIGMWLPCRQMARLPLECTHPTVLRP